MKLKLREVNDILQKEIVWCLDHPDPLLNNDQRMGFMNGLRQAEYLIGGAENALREVLKDGKPIN
jgi:hypothetical protein